MSYAEWRRLTEKDDERWRSSHCLITQGFGLATSKVTDGVPTWPQESLRVKVTVHIPLAAVGRRGENDAGSWCRLGQGWWLDARLRRTTKRRAKSRTTIIGTAVSDGTPASVASQIVAAAVVTVQTSATTPTASGLPPIDDHSMGSSAASVKLRQCPVYRAA